MLQVVAGIIEIDGFILLCQRHAKEKRFPLKWEFPGGKIKDGESPREAIIRELKEELGIQATGIKHFNEYDYQYKNESPIQLIFFTITRYERTIQNRQFEAMAWVSREKLHKYDILDGDQQLVEVLITDTL
ncbi:MAG: (deoxy)nucleoside triphosphate pyrophosphohydrolase [Candidatus Marinimicrobia bacterium]|nr:(deoxy)nucleoside triphosphate pyrophosphohydrolase [Candidatus Neomarinimicrobiota bacterium]